MNSSNKKVFTAKLEIIGINPYVFVPDDILMSIFIQANIDKGPIPVRGKINGRYFEQTLVKYDGFWRLYVNTKMLQKSPKHVGEMVEVWVEFDPTDRKIKSHPDFEEALANNAEAKLQFYRLAPFYKKKLYGISHF
jgi:hypothetical protein